MSELSNEALALWTLVAAFIAWAALNFFTSPKESHNNVNARLSSLEAAHQTLALRFEGSFARHDESLEHLTESIDNLTAEMKALQQMVAKIGNARRR